MGYGFTPSSTRNLQSDYMHPATADWQAALSHKSSERGLDIILVGLIRQPERSMEWRRQQWKNWSFQGKSERAKMQRDRR